MIKIKIPSKEDVISYYINTTKTVKEAALYFNISEVTFRRLLRKYNIRKTDENKYKTHLEHVSERIHKKPSREEIEKYYIIENHSKKECLEYFNVSCSTFSRWLKSYEILKPEDKKKERCVIGQSYKKIPRPTVEELENGYSKSTLTKDEAAKNFNVSLSTFCRWLEEKNVKKDSDLVIKTIQRSFLEKYGIEWAHTSHIQHYDIWTDKEKFINQLSSGFDHKPSQNDICEFFNVGLTSVQRKLNEFNCHELLSSGSPRSHYEDEIATIYGDCELNVKNVLDGYEIDLYYEKEKIGIEFNGDYWHSDLFKEKDYHFKKAIEASKKGIRLIHIYEHEWNDPVKKEIINSLLNITFKKQTEKIYARQCSIRLIENKEAKPFNDMNHLQGHRNAEVTYGLFYKNNLVQLMSFSRTKYNRNLKNENDWEIIRGCPGSNNIVIGGVSKLFKHFIKEHNPDKIFSYCDFNKFDGKSYESIGMKFIGYTGPDMLWLLRDGKVAKRSPKMHKILKEEAMGKIWGAGSKKYLWTKEE